MSQWSCDEHVHQFQMFAILQYVVKLVIKPIIFSPITRKPALYPNSCAWAQMLAAKCEKYEEDTISQYIMWHCDLDL